LFCWRCDIHFVLSCFGLFWSCSILLCFVWLCFFFFLLWFG
jgi:hypothetical protein